MSLSARTEKWLGHFPKHNIKVWHWSEWLRGDGSYQSFLNADGQAAGAVSQKRMELKVHREFKNVAGSPSYRCPRAPSSFRTVDGVLKKEEPSIKSIFQKQQQEIPAVVA